MKSLEKGGFLGKKRKICQTAYNELERQERGPHFLTMTTPNDDTNAEVVINDSDMTQDMQDQAVSIAKMGMSAGGNGDVNEPFLASYITREMENLHGGNWNCVVIKNVVGNVDLYFGHEGIFINFCIGDTAILLFKAPVEDEE